MRTIDKLFIKAECLKYAVSKHLEIDELDGDDFKAGDSEVEINVPYGFIFKMVSNNGFTVEEVLDNESGWVGDRNK